MLTPLDSSTTILSWTAHPDAVMYRVIFSRQGQTVLRIRVHPVNCVDGICTLDLASHPRARGLQSGARYRWHVQAILPDQRLGSSSSRVRISSQQQLNDGCQLQTVPTEPRNPLPTLVEMGPIIPGLIPMSNPTCTPTATTPTLTPSGTHLGGNCPYGYAGYDVRDTSSWWANGVFDPDIGERRSGSDGTLILNIRPEYSAYPYYYISIHLMGDYRQPDPTRAQFIRVSIASNTRKQYRAHSSVNFEIYPPITTTQIIFQGESDTPNWTRVISLKGLALRYCRLAPTATPTPPPVCRVTVIQNTTVWTRPDGTGVGMRQLRVGDQVTVEGRVYPPNESWYRVYNPSNYNYGWVHWSALDHGDLAKPECQNLPPFSGSGGRLPTFTPTMTPTPTITFTPSPTIEPQFAWYVKCSDGMSRDSRLNVRREPILDQYVNGLTNVVGSVEPDTLLVRRDLTTERLFVDAYGNLIVFVKIRYAPVGYPEDDYYVAFSITIQGVIRHFISDDRDETCGSGDTSIVIDPNDPNRRAYFETFRGAIFWAVYNETSMAQMEDRYSHIESVLTNPNDLRPRLSDFPSDPASLAVFNAQPGGYHRYLQSRVVTNNVLEYNSDAPDPFAGYVRGFGFMRRWGGSLNTPTNDDLWFNGLLCRDTHGHHASGYIGDYAKSFVYIHNINGIGLRSLVRDQNGEYIHEGIRYRLANQNDYKVVLDWLTDYANCRKQFNSEDSFGVAYDRIMPFVDLAIEHQIKGISSPDGDAIMILHANATYYLDESGAMIANAAVFCTEFNCRDPLWTNSYRETIDLDDEDNPNRISMQTWTSQYPNLPEIYRTGSHPQYLPQPFNIDQEIDYSTEIGFMYFLTGGLYTINGRNLYFVMSDHKLEIPNGADTVESAFQRHWNRLNKANNPVSPMAYRPNYCVTAMSHVLRTEPLGARTWITVVYQKAGRPAGGGENWYCG